MSLANKLTVSRLAAVPFFVIAACWTFPYHNVAAAVIFVLAGVTDILDGYFARKQGTVSGFGMIFDPIADKILMLAALLPLTAAGRIPIWLTLVLEAREFLISAVRIQAAGRGQKIIAASKLGKLKTVLQDIAVVMMLLEGELPFLKNWFISDIVMGAALVFTLWSLGEYIWKNRSLFDGL